MAFFGPKLRRFGRAPPHLSPPPRAATGELGAQTLDLGKPGVFFLAGFRGVSEWGGSGGGV